MMSYKKTTWVNGETKLNADNMNNIENGIEAIDKQVNAFPLTFALLSDIPSLYHHRIMLSVPAGRSFIFDAVTTNNTPIDSLTDLFTKLGNTEYGGCGYVSDKQLSNMIHVGTDSASTYFLSATGAGTQVTLASSGFTFVSDSVTAISVSPRANAKESPVWNEEEEEPSTESK